MAFLEKPWRKAENSKPTSDVHKAMTTSCSLSGGCWLDGLLVTVFRLFRHQQPIHTPSIAFRHLPWRKDVVNQSLEFAPDLQPWHLQQKLLATCFYVHICGHFRFVVVTTQHHKAARYWCSCPMSHPQLTGDGGKATDTMCSPAPKLVHLLGCNTEAALSLALWYWWHYTKQSVVSGFNTDCCYTKFSVFSTAATTPSLLSSLSLHRNTATLSVVSCLWFQYRCYYSKLSVVSTAAVEIFPQQA